MFRVLIADNEAASAQLRDCMQAEGLEYNLACDSEEMWLRLKLLRFDIVFIDNHVQLDFKGDLLTAIRSRYPHLKVILLTDAPDIHSATQAIRGGAFDYIIKPCRREDILRAVHNARKMIELDEENKRLLFENLRYQEQLEDLVYERTKALALISSRIIEIQEDERMRISREIHDDLGQSLLALKLSIQSEFAGLKNTSDKFKSGFSGILEYLNQIIDTSRKLSHNLSPIALESLGLPLAVKSMAENMNKDRRYRLTVELEDMDGFFDRNWNINLYRVMQECLTNAVKHSNANSIFIKAERNRNVLTVMIRDDGVGFITDPSLHGSGIGLLIMQQRVQLIGGRIHIYSSPGKGTEISIDIEK